MISDENNWLHLFRTPQLAHRRRKLQKQARALARDLAAIDAELDRRATEAPVADPQTPDVTAIPPSPKTGQAHPHHQDPRFYETADIIPLPPWLR